MGSFSRCGNHAVACSGGSRTRRPVTLLPLLALCRSAACQRARGCSFHHAIPGRHSRTPVWNGFPSKRVSHCAGVGARVQLGGAKIVAVSGHLPAAKRCCTCHQMVHGFEPGGSSMPLAGADSENAAHRLKIAL